MYRMTERQAKTVLWLTMPVILAFVVAIIAANAFAVPTHSMPGHTHNSLPGPGGEGHACSSSGMAFYGIDNPYMPGEIGIESFLGCNAPVNIVGSTCLVEWWPWGWVPTPNGPCGLKKKNGVLGMSMTAWYACFGGISSLATQEYKGNALWNVQFVADGYTISPDITDDTGAHFSKCMNPALVEIQ